MRRIIKAWLLLTGLLSGGFTAMAQLPECDKIYFEVLTGAPSGIYIYDPALPPGANNPVLNTIASLPNSGGLAVSKILGTTNNTYTFYRTIGGIFHYYDPVSLTWVNTGHLAGAGAVNIGGGGGFIYSLNGATGDVYRYDGSGDAILILSGNDLTGTVYDITVDCEGNFYMFKPLTTLANPFTYLRKYNPSGTLLQQWSIVNPNGLRINSGFHIVGDILYAGYLFGFPIPTASGVASVQITGSIIDFGNAMLTGTLTSMPGYATDWGTCQIGQERMAEITIAASDTVMCGAREVDFWVTGVENQGDAPAYQWFVNGAPVAGATDTFYSYTPQNGDVVSCQLVSSDLCTTPSTVVSDPVVMVVDNAAQPVLSYSPNAFCINSTAAILPDINTSGGTFSSTAGLDINATTGEVNPSLSTPGEYVITYTNPAPVVCPQYSTLTVVNVYPPANAHIELDKFKQPVCLADTVVLRAAEAKGSIYYWEPSERIIGVKDESSAVVDRKTSGYITLTVHAKGLCMDRDSIWIDEGRSCCRVFVPNAFTPNGDGLNDKVEIDTREIQGLSNLKIYNRYGQMVFEGVGTAEMWDGTSKGKVCDQGVYYYLLSYTCDDGRLMYKKGDITLIR